MKIYEGARSLDGAIVTVDGKKLPPRLDLRTFSKAGFEWSYEGAGPASRTSTPGAAATCITRLATSTRRIGCGTWS